MSLTLTGALPSQIGDIYDIAIGYSANAISAEMVGYVSAPGSTFEQDSDITDSDRIVTVDSPNSTDRYSVYPKVSQGDWSGDSRQLVFVDPKSFYDTTGFIDTTTPGQLTSFSNANLTNVTVAAGANHQRAPMVADGQYVYCGAYSPGVFNILIANPGLFGAGPFLQYSFAAGVEVIDLLMTPVGVMAQVVGGIYRLAFDGTTLTSFQQTNDAGAFTHVKGMAYFGDKLYYIATADQFIHSLAAVDGGAVAGTLFRTGGAFETCFRCLCSAANGLFYVKNGPDAYPNNNKSYLYVDDGTTATRVGVIPGFVITAEEVNGVVYILAILPAALSGGLGCSYVLYQLSGSTLSVIDDTRWLLADFTTAGGGQAPTTTVEPLIRARLFGDGRYLYLAWPGNTFLRYDLENNNAVLRIWQPNTFGGSSPFYNAYAASIAVTNGAIYCAITSTGSFAAPRPVQTLALDKAVVIGSSPAIGTETSSWYDFGTPDTVKHFRSFEFTTPTAPPVSFRSFYAVSYQIDNAAPVAFTLLSTNGNPTQFTGYFPAGTKGFRVRFLIKLTPDSSTDYVPNIQKYSVLATLGRIWKVTLACRRNQSGRNGEPRPDKKSGLALMANLENAYNLAAGNVVMYVPDSTATAAVGNIPAGVSRVNGTIQTIARQNVNGSAAGLREELGGGAADMEGDIVLQIAEDLDA